MIAGFLDKNELFKHAYLKIQAFRLYKLEQLPPV
jgi:hypothetical protein